MYSIKHHTNTHIFGAPEGWDQSAIPCGNLGVTVCPPPTNDMPPSLVTFWKPEPAELAVLNANGAVMLQLIAGGMPPVSMAVEAPKYGMQMEANPAPCAAKVMPATPFDEAVDLLQHVQEELLHLSSRFGDQTGADEFKGPSGSTFDLHLRVKHFLRQYKREKQYVRVQKKDGGA